MKHRIILAVICIILGLLYFYSDFFKNPVNLGMCANGGWCESDWFYGFFLPVYNFLLYIIISFIVLILFSYSYLKLWMKIMIPYFVIALLLVINTKPLCGGMICFNRTIIAGGFAKLFLIFTILIIIGKSIQLFIISKNKKKN